LSLMEFNSIELNFNPIVEFSIELEFKIYSMYLKSI
jgi:hypothetical protein